MINIPMNMTSDDITAALADFDCYANIISLMKDYQPETFIPIFCMIAEEWAKVHGEDVCDLIDLTAELVHGVNEACGRY